MSLKWKMASFNVKTIEEAHASLRDFPTNWINCKAPHAPERVEVWQCRDCPSIIAIIDGEDVRTGAYFVIVEQYTRAQKQALYWYVKPKRERKVMIDDGNGDAIAGMDDARRGR